MTTAPAEPEESTHFGYEEVRLAEKQERVDDVFHKVAHRYDVMNDLMSGGLHRLWKDQFAAKVNAGARPGFRHLDVAGGTGDVAIRVAKAGGPAFVVHRLPFHRRPSQLTKSAHKVSSQSRLTKSARLSAQKATNGSAARVHLHRLPL